MYDPLADGMAPWAAAWCEIQDLSNGGGSHRKVSTIPLLQTTLSTVIRMQFEEIHINSHEIRTKFVRKSYEIRANFVQISCEFQLNRFV